MADLAQDIKGPNKLEKMGCFIATFIAARDAPEIIKISSIEYLLPIYTRTWLLGVNNNSDFWRLWLFIVMVIFLSLWLLYRDKVPNKNQQNDSFNDDDRWKRAFKRYKLIRYLRTLGFAWIREKFLGFQGVKIYGTFTRESSHWPDEPGRADSVDRISFTNNTIEYQYMADGTSLIIRSCSSNQNRTFGEEEHRDVKWNDFRILLIASNYFPFWLILYYWQKIKKFCQEHLKK